MNRSLLIGIIVTFLIIGSLATIFYINYIKVKSVPAINAVPSDAALIFEVKNIHSCWGSFVNSDLWLDLQKNEGVSQLSGKIHFIDSIISINPMLQGIIADNKSVISFHTQGGQKLSMLFVAETGKKMDASSLADWISQTLKYTIRKRNFESETVYDFLDKDKLSVMSLSARDQLLICSSDGALVEESLRKLKYKLPNLTQGFEQVSAMAEVSSDASIYVNYQYLPSFMNLFSKSEYFGLFDYLKRFANWSMFDLKITKEHFSLSGLSYTDDSVFQYLDLFKSQAPLQMSLHKILPKSTAMMLQTAYSDYPKFGVDLTEYLQVHKKLENYIHFTDSLENRYGIDLGDKFISLIGKEAMLGMLEPIGSDYNNELFAVLNFNNKVQAESLLKSYIIEIAKRGEHDSAVIPAYNGYNIEHLQLGNFLKLYYGEIFENIYSPYYTIINDAFVFANNVSTIKMIIDNYSSGNTLDKDEQYQKFNEQSATTSNLSFFVSPNHCFLLPALYVTDEFFSLLNRSQYDFKKFECISVQYANTNNKEFFTNLNFKFNPSFKEDTRLFWAVKLDTAFDVQPAVVFNSSTRQNCIIVQDLNNTVYYINNTGTILWKSKLSGKIMSEIKQVDAQKNGRIYYLFNTDKQACLIDENGNNMPGYPVRFPGKATAGFSLFDFNNDSSYQFFIPLENNKIIAYQINGKPVQGWNPKTTEEKISTKISSVTISGKSYLFAPGSKGSLFIYSAKGERVRQEVKLNISGNLPVFAFAADSLNSFVAFADTGSIFNIYSIDSTMLLTLSNSYSFGVKPEYIDAYMSPLTKEWVVLSGDKKEFSVYDKPDHKSVNKSITDSLFIKPFINFNNKGEVMIGYTDKTPGQQYWFTSSGLLYPSFPMQGSTVFGTGNLMMNGNNYLITGDKQNNLVLIRLK